MTSDARHDLVPDLPIGNLGAYALLAGLFPDGCEGFVEARLIFIKGGPPIQDFWSIAERNCVYHSNTRRAQFSDVYFGVAPRSREAGDASAVEVVYAAWVDIDKPTAAGHLAAFAIQPSAVVASGTEGHLQAYFFLNGATAPERVEQINRALAEQLSGDPQCVDRARVMRLPGTYNHKKKPPTKAELITCDGELRYAPEELERALGISLDAPSEDPKTGVENPALHRVLERLTEVKPSSTGWTALCPAHDDRRPSLSIAEGEDGRCLLHCHAGCTVEAVVEGLGLEVSDLFEGNANGRQRASSRLIHLAERVGIEVFHTPERSAHAAITVDEHQETWSIRSSGFAQWLRRLHYEDRGEGLGDEVLNETIATFEAKALFAGAERTVHRRVAELGNRIVIDLGDETWRGIEVSPDGWEVVSRPAAHFVRDQTTMALPEPERGGSIEELREFANCANEGSWLRLCGILVAYLKPRGPFPLTYPTGEQGSAKSTLSRMIVSLVDPRIAPLMMGSPTTRDLAVAANSVWLVGFDNVSKVSPALSDALCQLATGGGYRTRQLYTDGDTFVLDLTRPVLLNAIGQVIDRPDLLDRVALVELAPIAPENRLPEDEFWKRWDTARPRILGAVLDGVAAALAGAEHVKLDGFPRMADFARWGEAAGMAFGWDPGVFTAAIENARDDLLEGSADAYPEIGAVLELMDKREAWIGPAGELLKTLTNLVGEKVAGGRDWPKRADQLSNRLTQHAPLLRSQGIEVTRGRKAGGNRARFIRLTRVVSGSERDAGTPGDAS